MILSIIILTSIFAGLLIIVVEGAFKNRADEIEDELSHLDFVATNLKQKLQKINDRYDYLEDTIQATQDYIVSTDEDKQLRKEFMNY